MRLLILFLFSVLLTACATPNPSISESINSDKNLCTYQLGDITNINEVIEGGYVCPSSSPEAGYAINECSLVKEYTRKNGTVIAEHTRCKYNLPPISSYSTPSSSSSSAPCVTNYCGPVHVKGYYRKNGTYVSPHTRSRPRR